MKPLIVIPIITFAAVALVAALAAACGARFAATLPLVAAGISAAAGVLGFAPILLAKRKDPVGVLQLALVGTILHLAASVGLTCAAIAAQLVLAKLPFVYWLLAGYWISLIVLLWQLRHRLLSVIEPAAPNSQLKSATP